jgi:hypothetical protein
MQGLESAATCWDTHEPLPSLWTHSQEAQSSQGYRDQDESRSRREARSYCTRYGRYTDYGRADSQRQALETRGRDEIAEAQASERRYATAVQARGMTKRRMGTPRGSAVIYRAATLVVHVGADNAA